VARNHREVIAAMDFFTVPTLTFGVLYCFYLIALLRSQILDLDRASNFDGDVIDTIKSSANPTESIDLRCSESAEKRSHGYNPYHLSAWTPAGAGFGS
jgi:hypothetical protein